MALSPEEIAQFHGLLNAAQVKPHAAPVAKKGGFLSHLLPTATSIAGGTAGAALGTALLPGVGTLAGALLGGALGGGGGKVAENAIEHNALGDGVLKEGAIDGVLSAGPLKLGKLGIDTIKGVKAGTGLADATKAAGVGAANMSILRNVGNSLTGASNNMAVKSFRLTPTQLNNFKSKYGEDAASVIKRYNLVGKNAEDIQSNVIKPLQESFTQGVAQIPSINKQTVIDALRAKASALLDSHAPDTQAIGKQLMTVSKGLDKKLGDDISGSDLNAVKNQFDSLVNYTEKSANPSNYKVNKHVADTLRNVIHNAGDTAGVSVEGTSLKNAGMELSKLRQLSDNIAKQSQLGKGSLPFGLDGLAGAGAAGATFGGPGAVGGFAATKIVNSATGRRAIAKGAENAGERLIARGDKNAAKAFGVTGIGKKVGAVGLLNAAANSQSLSNNMDQTNMDATSMNPATNANMAGLYQSNPDLSSSTDQQPAMTKDMLVNALMTDIASTGGKNIDKIKTVYALLGPDTSASSKPSAGYSKPTASQYSQGVTGMQAIDALEQLVGGDPSLVNRNAAPGQNLPGVGGLVSHAAGTSQYRAISNNILNSIARINTGANMPESEAGFYSRTYLPQPGDDPATIAAKINSLRQFFDPIVNYQSDSSASGGDATDLASALAGL